MLIGNRNDLAIEVLPLAPTWERRYLPERTGWAQLAIWVHGTNLCRNHLEGSDSIREGINVPLAPVADWLMRSWTFIEFEERPGCFPPRNSLRRTLRDWGDTAPAAGFTEDQWFDARELWWTRHFLSAGADGARLPNVSLVRSSDRLVIEWGPAEFPGDHAPRFISEHGQEVLEWRRCSKMPATSTRPPSRPETFERIMERYGVGARTAAFQLWNHGLLSSSQVRDELIDCFSEVAG